VRRRVRIVKGFAAGGRARRATTAPERGANSPKSFERRRIARCA
jgi:hypothetical protein